MSEHKKVSEQNTLSKFHSVALAVADIEQSVHWYTSSFRCEVLIQNETSAMLQFANLKLTLYLPSQQPSHVAVFKHDANTYGELRPQLDGTTGTFVSDPTGNLVKLIAEES